MMQLAQTLKDEEMKEKTRDEQISLFHIGHHYCILMTQVTPTPYGEEREAGMNQSIDFISNAHHSNDAAQTDLTG